jgi:surfactin synthase thioesterase subunit
MVLFASKYPKADIWTFDYPGFGKSRGTMTTTSMLDKAYQFLKALQSKYTSWTWVGESIGAAVAMGVLHRKEPLWYLPSHVTLINSFSSIGSMAHDENPLGSILVEKFDFEMKPKKWIETCKKHYKDKMPKLTVCRAINDDKIPMKHTRKLADAAGVTISSIEGDHFNYIL